MNINTPTEYLVTFSNDELKTLNTAHTILTNLVEGMDSVMCDLLSAEYKYGTNEIALTQLDDMINLLSVFTITDNKDAIFKVRSEN